MSMDLRAPRIRLRRATSAFCPMLSSVTVLRGFSRVESAIARSACARNGEGLAQRSVRSQSMRLSADSAMMWSARWMRLVESGAQPASSSSAKAHRPPPNFACEVFSIARIIRGPSMRRRQLVEADPQIQFHLVRKHAAPRAHPEVRTHDHPAHADHARQRLALAIGRQQCKHYRMAFSVQGQQAAQRAAARQFVQRKRIRIETDHRELRCVEEARAERMRAIRSEEHTSEL